MDKIWFCEGETLINYRSQLLAEPASSVVGIIARARVTFVLASWSFTSSQPASKSLNKKLENLQLRSVGWGTRWQQVAWQKYFSLQEINFASRGFPVFLYGRFASRVATWGKKGYFPILEMDSALRALLWSHIVKLNHTSVTLCTQSTSSLGWESRIMVPALS